MTNEMPLPPSKPTLAIIPSKDDGFCLDKNNAIKLGDYIQQLEQGYQ